MAVIGELATLVTARTAPFERGMQRSQRSVREFSGTTKRAQAVLTGFVSGLTAAATQAGIAAAKFAVFRGLQLAADAEQAQVSFKVLLGTLKDANRVIKEIREFAASTPFQSADLIQSAKLLAAFNFEADELVPTLRRLGELSSAMGTPIKEIALIYGKARVAGRLFAEDVNQFIERGIDIGTQFKDILGVETNAEVRKLVSEGQVGFAQLEEAIRRMTDEGGKFHGLMQAQSKTTIGALSTLKDNISAMLRTLGEAVLKGGDVSTSLQDMTAAIQEAGPALRGFAKDLGEVVSVMAKLVRTWSQLEELTGGLGLFRGALGNLSDMIDKFNKLRGRGPMPIGSGAGAVLGFDPITGRPLNTGGGAASSPAPAALGGLAGGAAGVGGLGVGFGSLSRVAGAAITAIAERTKREMEERKRRGDDITSSLRTPIEMFSDRVHDLTALSDKGAISRETLRRGVEAARTDLFASVTKTPIRAQLAGASGAARGSVAAERIKQTAKLEEKALSVAESQLEELRRMATAIEDVLGLDSVVGSLTGTA